MTNETVFYQQVSARLRKACIFGALGLALGATMIFAARNIYFLFWMYVILTSLLVLALAYNILYAIALRQPMLTLTPRSLIYRKVSIPWQFISDVTELKTPGGTTVGISLSQGYFRVTPTESSVIPRPTMGFLLRKSLAKYGAISVPQARGMTIEGLRQAIADYRELALTGRT